MRILLMRLLLGWWVILGLTITMWIPLLSFGMKEGWKEYCEMCNYAWNGEEEIKEVKMKGKIRKLEDDFGRKKVEIRGMDLSHYSFMEAWYYARKAGYLDFKGITMKDKTYITMIEHAKMIDGFNLFDIFERMTDIRGYKIILDSKLAEDEWWITFGHGDDRMIVGSKGA